MNTRALVGMGLLSVVMACGPGTKQPQQGNSGSQEADAWGVEDCWTVKDTEPKTPHAEDTFECCTVG